MTKKFINIQHILINFVAAWKYESGAVAHKISYMEYIYTKSWIFTYSFSVYMYTITYKYIMNDADHVMDFVFFLFWFF